MVGLTTLGKGRALIAVLAIAIVTAAALSLTPAIAHAQTRAETGYVECEANGKVCEQVVTRNAGGDYVEYVTIYTNISSPRNRTFRLLINGKVVSQQGLASPRNKEFAFNVLANVQPATCIQGGIVDFGRSVCWWAPPR